METYTATQEAMVESIVPHVTIAHMLGGHRNCGQIVCNPWSCSDPLTPFTNAAFATPNPKPGTTRTLYIIWTSKNNWLKFETPNINFPGRLWQKSGWVLVTRQLWNLLLYYKTAYRYFVYWYFDRLLFLFRKRQYYPRKMGNSAWHLEQRKRRWRMPGYSHSQLAAYETCPQKYQLSYIYNIEVEKGGVRPLWVRGFMKPWGSSAAI